MTLEDWESIFIDYITLHCADNDDGSHDLGHFRRVFQTAKNIASQEDVPVDLLVILASAYFHDIVSLPKNHPERNMSSSYAADKAKEILQQLNFPQEKIEPVSHAIKTHSFSAGLQPETIEAKIIQDADRMEALGTLGAMRTFYVSGRLERPPFDPEDMFAERRPLNDRMFGLDHFYVKLFKLPGMLQTRGGRNLANTRAHYLEMFVEELVDNVKNNGGGALVVVDACCQAGQRGLPLFDMGDPFATTRSLETDRFVIDRLIDEKEKYPDFLGMFLAQFQNEMDMNEPSITYMFTGSAIQSPLRGSVSCLN